MKKRLFFTMIATLLLTTLSPVIVSANNLPAYHNSNYNVSVEITPRADDIRYQYKVINNVLYKRLYNYTTNKALSGWTKA